MYRLIVITNMEVAFSSKRREEVKVMYNVLLKSKLRIRRLSLHTNEQYLDYDYLTFNTNKYEKLFKIEKYLEQFGFIWLDKWSETPSSYVMGIKRYGGVGWDYDYKQWKKEYEKEL